MTSRRLLLSKDLQKKSSLLGRRLVLKSAMSCLRLMFRENLRVFTLCVGICVSLFTSACANQEMPQTSEGVEASETSSLSQFVEEQVAVHSDRDTFTIVAVGDMMVGTDFPSKSSLPPNDDPDALLSPVASYIRAADIAFGNLEGAFLDGGKPAKGCRDLSNCYLFRMPTRYAAAFQRAGFDLLSLANNHVGDFGTPAQNRTRALLDSLGIRHAGLVVHPTDTLTVKGLRIGFCAFAPNSGTCQLNDYALLRRTVEKLKKENDIVIASCHMGAEGAKHTHVTKQKEIFLGENRGNVYEIARVLIDAGADMVLGHGPHVTRAMDLYKGRFIVYSMGNFCTYGRFSLKGVSGIAPLLQIRITRDGRFVDGRVIATKQISPGGTLLDPSGRVIEEMRQLMSQDLPATEIELLGDGQIRLKSKP